MNWVWCKDGIRDRWNGMGMEGEERGKLWSRYKINYKKKKLAMCTEMPVPCATSKMLFPIYL